MRLAAILAFSGLLLSSNVSSKKRGLELLHSGLSSEYYVSELPADAITAAETCTEMNKDFRLLSLENEEEFKDILASLRRKGIDSIWTSGLQTVSNLTTKYIWTSTSQPVGYTNFEDIFKSKGRLRMSRSVSGGYYPNSTPAPGSECDCNFCPDAPVCEAPECNINVPDCSIEQPYCELTHVPNCAILEPKPQCTISCPECTITRGVCTVVAPKCTVEPGTCTTSRGKCRVVQPECTVHKGKCSLVHQPCKVVQPEKPCNRGPKCSYGHGPHCDPISSNPNNAPSPNSAQAYKSIKGCKGKFCGTTPAPCKGSKCKCFQALHCIPDVVCLPPPVICPPAIQNCLPSELHCPPIQVDCGEPETTCTTPTVTCTNYEKKCTEDRIVCPSPKTTCTPAVSHCPLAEYNCTKPAITCPKPTVTCPDLPSCEVPPTCYNPASYGHGGNGHCDCKTAGGRFRRSLADGTVTHLDFLEPEEIVDTKCISLKKDFDFKWQVEGCEKKNHFICEAKKY